MANNAPRRTWDIASGLLLAGMAVLILATFRDYGMGWDEPDHRGYGERILGYYKGLWIDRPDPRVFTKGNLYLYGGAFDTAVQLLERISPLEPYDSRHLVTALVGWCGVAATVGLARAISGPMVGFLSGVLLVLTPLYYGHLFFNPKDLPFAAGTAVSLTLLVLFLRRLPRPGAACTLSLGLAIGLTMGVRVGGVQLLALLAVGTAWALAAGRGEGDRRWPRGAAAAIVAAAVAWGVMLAAWPWARLAPLANPWTALRTMSRFDWGLTVLFRGQWIPSQDLPRSYLPEYLLLTLPELFLAGLALALVLALTSLARGSRSLGDLVRSRRSLELSLTGAAALVPLGIAVLTRPPLYDGARHFLFTIPPLAVLAAIGIGRALAFPSRPIRTVVLVSVVAGVAVQVWSHWVLHPYAYVGYNSLAGGLRGADGRYETDYWGTSYRELVERLREDPASLGEGDRPVRVWVCSDPLLASWYFPVSWTLSPTPEEAEVILATTRWGCDTRYAGSPIAEVRRRDVRLSVAIRTPGVRSDRGTAP